MPTTLTSRKSSDDAKHWAAVRLVLQLDLYQLAKALYAGYDPNFLSPTFHKPICNAIQLTPYDENLYLISRGHFKTSIITVTQTIQRLLADPKSQYCQRRWRGRFCGPDTRILLASNKSESAEYMLEEIKQHLSTNETLLQAFPDLLRPDMDRRAPEWTKTAITLNRPNRALRGSSVQATGLTGELTSKHYDAAVLDDLVGKENSGSKEEREKVWDWIIKTEPLFNPGATKDFVGTFWHYDDAYTRLIEQKTMGVRKIGVYRQPCWSACEPGDPEGADVPGHGWVRPVFTEMYCLQRTRPDDRRKELLRIRDQGMSDFAAQYLLDPVPADTAHFLLSELKDHAPNDHPPLDNLSLLMTIDPAISTKSHADYSGIAVGGFDERSDLWILELLRVKRDDVALVSLVFDLYRRFQGRIRSIGFEAVGFAQTYRILFTLEGQRRGFYLPIVTLPRTTKITKNVRIGGLQGPWNSGQIHILRTCQAYEAFRDEAAKFRPDRESAHDDLLDAVGDLYEYRQTPYAKPAVPFTDDPEVAARIAFERSLADRGLDQMSLRVAWLHHRNQQQMEQERDAVAIGGGDFMGGL